MSCATVNFFNAARDSPMRWRSLRMMPALTVLTWRDQFARAVVDYIALVETLVNTATTDDGDVRQRGGG